MRRVLLWLCLALAPAAAFAAQNFTLDGPTLSAGASMPLTNVYTECGGGNVSPPLWWHDPPAGTKSFAVTMYDPDAPTGSGFWHWMAVNIPPDVTELKEGQASEGGKMPAGTIQARDDAGLSHYVGPCPPKGDAPHHYVITVYAVKVPKLEGIDSTSSGALVGFSLHYATVGKASMTYTYGR